MLRDYLELDVLNSFIPEMIFLIFRGPFNTPGAICKCACSRVWKYKDTAASRKSALFAIPCVRIEEYNREGRSSLTVSEMA